MDERGDNPAEEEVIEDDLVAGGTEPGQEGISVWDILGESFLQEVLQIGMFSVACF